MHGNEYRYYTKLSYSYDYRYAYATDVSTPPLDAGVNIHAANSKADSFNLAFTMSSIV